MMTTKTRSRVCAVGTEEDMRVLCRTLLENRGWLPAGDADTPPPTLEQLMALIRLHASREGGKDCGFYYGMVAEKPYGAALASSCRFEVRRHPSGLWTALFAYGGDTPFQPEDWLRFHRQCRMPMLALYADWDFGLEKGMKRFIGGRVQDDWCRMGETWMWLMAEYEDGYPPDESIERLCKLRVTLDREDFDMTIGELLTACIDNLEELTADTEDTEALAAQLRVCREEKDFTALLEIYQRVAETELWETARVKRWLANLQAVRALWYEEEGD